jgi:hypothetical protein
MTTMTMTKSRSAFRVAMLGGLLAACLVEARSLR